MDTLEALTVIGRRVDALEASTSATEGAGAPKPIPSAPTSSELGTLLKLPMPILRQLTRGIRNMLCDNPLLAVYGQNRTGQNANYGHNRGISGVELLQSVCQSKGLDFPNIARVYAAPHSSVRHT